MVQGVNTISPFLPFVCVDAVLEVIIKSSWDLFYGGYCVLSSHPIYLLVQVPRRTVRKIFSSLLFSIEHNKVIQRARMCGLGAL